MYPRYILSMMKFEFVEPDVSRQALNNLQGISDKSFERLRTNGKLLIPPVVNRELVERSNHEWDKLVQSYLKLYSLAQKMARQQTRQ